MTDRNDDWEAYCRLLAESTDLTDDEKRDAFRRGFIGRRGGKAFRDFIAAGERTKNAALGQAIISISADTSKAEAQIAAAHENVMRLQAAVAIRDMLRRRGLRALGFELAGGRPC